MTLRSETPPPPASLDADTPPDSDRPTVAQLKGDIDSGRTASKVPHADVGAASLGTCDEAAGTPPTPERVALARKAEAADAKARAAADPQGSRPWIVPAFAGAVVALGIVAALAVFLLR